MNITISRSYFFSDLDGQLTLHMNTKNLEVICCDLDGEHTLCCDTCDKTTKLKSKDIQFISFYHTTYEKLIEINHTIQIAIFFDI